MECGVIYSGQGCAENAALWMENINYCVCVCVSVLSLKLTCDEMTEDHLGSQIQYIAASTLICHVG